MDRQHNLIIIGAGNLGQAIANYANFEKRGFIIKGMFDINPRLIGLVVRGIEIRGVDDLEQFIKDNDVQMAAPVSYTHLYKQVAALFNASLNDSLNNEEQRKAFSETVLKVKKNSLDEASRSAVDIAALQEIIKQQAALKTLQISID